MVFLKIENMKKDMIFFGEKGITSTSANTVANLAKESLQSMESALNGVTFYSINVGLIGSPAKSAIQISTSKENVEKIPDMLTKIAKTKSLIAWLREAIKARESLRKEISAIGIAQFCVMQGIEYPDTPKYPHILTEDEYYGSLDIKVRNRYYYLETICSTIGKYIHPDGVYSRARKEMKDVSQKPFKVIGSGRDATIYENIVDRAVANTVEDTFFTLQDKHREAQKQLNSIKFECEKAIQASEAKADAEYKIAMEEHSVKIKEINGLFKAWYNEQNTKLSQLKIIIPESLQAIYDEISKLGK